MFLADEILGDALCLADYQQAEFVLNKEEDYRYRMEGNTVKICGVHRIGLADQSECVKWGGMEAISSCFMISLEECSTIQLLMNGYLAFG